jgi:hypothetical protein
VRASAAGPIVPPGGAIGEVAWAVADTAEAANQLLLSKLDKMGA